MTTGDWLMAGGMCLLLIGAWVQTYRLWRHRADISAGITWAVGEASAVGAQAFILPGCSGLTLAWLGVVVELAPDGKTSDASVDSVASWLMGLGFVLLMLGFWMWLFAWPRFLMPPHLRGRPGWIMALWHDRKRIREQRRQARRYALNNPRKRAGSRDTR